MGFFFLVIALITAGLSLAMGAVSLMSGVIERAVISSENDTLIIGNIHQGMEDLRTHLNPASTMELIEKEHILKILLESNWRINGENGAADILAMHPSTLRSRMKKLNIYRRTKEST